MSWQKQSHDGLRNGFSEGFLPPLPQSCIDANCAWAQEPSLVCCACCKPKSHIISNTQTFNPLRGG